MNPVRLFFDKMQLICPDITHEELKGFELKISVKNFKKKDLIFDKSKPQDHLAYITCGLIRSYYINEKGSEISAYFVKDFDFVSDYPAFLKETKSNYFFEALENTTAVLIPKSLILQAYATSPKFEKFGRLIAEEAVQFLQGRMESFLFKTATERYVEFMEIENEFMKRLSLDHIATYLGIERQSLTRIRKKLHSK
jgi:CRP/FNR family transcriptional regulator, anaerobic regulatory protein